MRKPVSIPAPAVYNLLLTLPDIDLWHERFVSWVIGRRSYSYAYSTRLGSPPLTRAMLEAAVQRGAKSRNAWDVAARREQWRELR